MCERAVLISGLCKKNDVKCDVTGVPGTPSSTKIDDSCASSQPSVTLKRVLGQKVLLVTLLLFHCLLATLQERVLAAEAEYKSGYSKLK